MRWNVELDLRNIKTTLDMEVLSCQSPPVLPSADHDEPLLFDSAVGQALLWITRNRSLGPSSVDIASGTPFHRYLSVTARSV